MCQIAAAFCSLYVLLNVCDSFKIEIVNYLGQRWELYNRIEKEVGTVKCNRVNKRANRQVPLYDFEAFWQAIKAARTARKESRKDVSDAMNISPRYLTNIENKGQQPSLQIFYELVTRYNISVDQFFFPDKCAEKSTQRRQLDTLLDGMSDKGLRSVTATAKEVAEIEQEDK